jgi:glycosyltransferase involved in cell wall biosynthesis
MSAQPLVSIVMPTYDRLEFLPAAVASIFAQTFENWELVIADDGSGEAVRGYLAALERRERVRVLRLEHTGNPGKARNAAIAAARAPLVAFMDSDDLWAPTKLETQLATLRAEPTCRWSYTGFVVVDAHDVPLPSERTRRWSGYGGDIFAEVVRGAASIRTPAVVVRTELVRDVGGFDEALDCAEDYDLWARLALESPVAVVDAPLVRVRRHRRGDHLQLGVPHASRDYSLRKLASRLDGERRALVNGERTRNALLHAAVFAAHGQRRRALATVARSLPFSWRSPRWWAGAAKASALACLGALRSEASSPGVKTRGQRVDQQ